MCTAVVHSGFHGYFHSNIGLTIYTVGWYVDVHVATCIVLRLAVLGLWHYWIQTIALRLEFQSLPSPTRCKIVRRFGGGCVCCCCSEWQLWCSGSAAGLWLSSWHYEAFSLRYTAQETMEPLHNGNVSIPSLYSRSLCISVFLQSRLIVLEHLLR